MKRIKKQKCAALIVIMLLLLSTILAACSSKSSSNEGSAKEEAAATQKEAEAAKEFQEEDSIEPEPAAETEPETGQKSAAEPGQESATGAGQESAAGAGQESAAGTNAEGGKAAEAKESEPEPVVYEGIDMESTLPWDEWMETFDGIVNEPKLVIVNDETNKKVIVENGQKVEFAEDDIMVIYSPKGKKCIIKVHDLNTFTKSKDDRHQSTLRGIARPYKIGDEKVTENILEYDGELYNLTATLIITEGSQ